VKKFQWISIVLLVASLGVFAGESAGTEASPAAAPRPVAAQPAPEPVPVPKANPAAPQLPLDHFLVYRINPINVNFGAWFRGQFDNNWISHPLTNYTRFLNPVDKNNEGIFDPFRHLNWYDIAQQMQEPNRQVEVENQFGFQEMQLGQPVAVLIPCEKIEPGSQFPAGLDHYKVYKASGFPVQRDVQLRDQFGQYGSIVYEPVYFAVPVEKRHNGKYFPINNPSEHLVFYRLDPMPANHARPTRDQFGNLPMSTISTELLGVPTIKLGWQVIP
jgi:hypothetical protein